MVDDCAAAVEVTVPESVVVSVGETGAALLPGTLVVLAAVPLVDVDGGATVLCGSFVETMTVENTPALVPAAPDVVELSASGDTIVSDNLHVYQRQDVQVPPVVTMTEANVIWLVWLKLSSSKLKTFRT